jgi:ADP-heptose:LPS heptosyltransferase
MILDAGNEDESGPETIPMHIAAVGGEKRVCLFKDRPKQDPNPGVEPGAPE